MVSVDGAVWLFGALMLLILPLNWLSAVIFAAAVHELCHLGMILLLRGRVEGVRVGVSGAVIALEPMDAWKEVLCAAAGPLGSFLLVLTVARFPRLALCGLVQGAFNLIPLLPLDGGRMVYGCMRLLVPTRADMLYKGFKRGMLLVLIPLVCAALWRISPVFFLWLLAFAGIRLGFQRKRPCKAPQIGVQ